MKHRLRDRTLKLTEKKETVQEDPYRLSIHTSTNFNKSDSGSKRLNLSRMLENSRKKISMRKASQLFQSGVRPHSSKTFKRNEVIEFDNMKWISIISAYDPTRLKNVSVSKKTCQKFLETQGQNIKTDSRSLLYFNDLIKNFKSWLNKIHIQYFYIMENFLYGKRSVNVTLADLRPKIDEVINQTSHMQQNLQNCLKSYQNHEFRQLLRKYHAYLQNSKEIEDIIIIVNKSKTKIVELYKKFDDDKKIEEKLNRVKNDGIHQVKKIICQHKQIQIENQIMERIQTAINEMAEKSGEAYRKIRGIKQLISRFKNTEYESGQVMQKLDMESINLMGKVCREICFEADAFDAFSSKFLLEGDIINDDLKNIIRKYEEDMAIERKRAIELQMKFLNIILSETIKKLKQNSKICVVYQNAEAHHEEYRKVLRMIQDVADCLTDQNKKVTLEKLIKQTKTIFDRLYDELKYLKENKKFEQIDTEEGLISILEVSKLIKEYKDKILLVRKKFQTTYREIVMTPIKIQQISQDRQTDFINAIISLSKKINNSNLKDRIKEISCFSPVTHQTGLVKMSQQIDEENILEDIKAISNEFLQLQQQNILQQLFGPLKLENLIFKESIIMLNLKKLSLQTQQKNIIPQLTDLLKKRNQWVEKHKKTSSQMNRYFERILAKTLVKGLKPQDIKEIQNPRSIPFPTKDTQIEPLRSNAKYRQVLLDLIQNSVVQTNKSFHSEASGKGDYQEKSLNTKSKNSFFVSDILQRNITNINDFIGSFTKITQIKKNINSEYFLAKQYLIEFSEKLFSMVYLQNLKKDSRRNEDSQKISGWIKSLINICNQRILFLTRAILTEQNDWRSKQKKISLENSKDSNKIPVHVQKVIELLDFYKNRTLEMSDSCAKTLEIFNQSIQNVQNSRQMIDQFLKLSLYAKILVSVVKYCKHTQQIVHVILDNSKSPIALANPKENSLRQLFPGLKKGKYLTSAQIEKLTLNIPKIGIQLKFKRNKLQDLQQTPTQSKKITKQTKKESSIMDEDIVQESQASMKEEMMDQILDEDVQKIDDFEEEMPQDQMDEEVEQEPQEMVEDFQTPEDQVGDDVEQENLDQLIEESQNIGKSKKQTKSKNQIDDFEEYEWQEDEQKQKNKNKKLEEDQKAKQLKAKEQEEAKKKQLQAKKKQEQQRKAKQKEELQRQKRMKKQHIVFSQTQLPKKIIEYSVYEVLSFVTSLHQLKTLISYMYTFEETYMNSSIQWSKIQHYFNNHYVTTESDTKESQEKAKKDVQKYIKMIDQEVDNKLKKDFQSQPSVFNQIKGLETVKNLKKNLLLLKNGNWQTLQKMLLANHVTYNVLKSDKSILYIFIKDSSIEYDEYGSIDGYLSKNFKYYKRVQFDIKSFAEKCFINLNTIGTKTESFRIITYVAKNQRSLISNQTQIENTYEQLKLTLQNFSNGAKDHINKFDLCLDLYKKALQIKQKVELDLNWYSDQIKFLQKAGTDQSDILSYAIFIKDNIKNVIKKVKSLESKLYNLSFKCQKNNIFECFEEMAELYGDQIETKQVLKKGQRKFTTLVFDKTNYKQNFNKIKKIISNQPTSKQSHVQKIIISLLFGIEGQIQKQIDENSILESSKKITSKEHELLLQIFCTLRVNHSYILIKEKGLEFFTLRKQQNECISNFIVKLVNSVMENKQISNLITTNPFLAPLKSIQGSTDNQLYKKVFTPSMIKTLFTERVNQNTHLKQIQVIVNQKSFDLRNKNWNQDCQRVIKEIMECLGTEKKQCQTVLENMTRLKPSKFIYEKHLSNEKSKEISSLWKEHLNSFQKLQQTGSQLLKNNHWLLAIQSISSELEISVIQSIEKHLSAINSILSTQNKGKSLQEIESQLTKVFQWVNTLIEPDSKHKFLVVTRFGQKSILYFDFNIESISLEYFMENLNFLQPNNVQIKQFLFNLLFNNLTSEKSEQSKTSLQLRKKDVLYQIDSQKIFNSVFSAISNISSQEHHKKRHSKIREFVRLFNRIYFISKTTKNLNFKQESQALLKLQGQIKNELKQLDLIYSFKKFIEMYGRSLWKGNVQLNKLNQLLQNEFMKNEKIPDDQISDILAKLQRIKLNKNSSTIDSYDHFFAWVYHTVMSLLKLPFYNIITHTVLNEDSKAQNEFLAVVVTQNFSVPGQNNQELEECLKEMFAFTEHKPIYLKENDLTVELTKEPAFVELSFTIRDLQLKQIVDFLNENSQEEDKTDSSSNKQLYLRVDELREIMNSKGKREDQQIFIKLIPLKDFLKSSEQQFNLQISQQKLCSAIECNIIYAPSQISDKTSIQQCLPLNGSLVDSFDDVYMGKHLKLEKLPEWLYTFYKSRKSEVDIKNKQLELQNFFKDFIEFHKNNVLPENKQVLQKIFKNISFEDISKSKSQSKDNILFLSSSLILKEQFSKNLNLFKQKLYESKPQIQELYDFDIKQLAKKIENQVLIQLEALQGEIRIKMQKKIKKLAAEKVKEIQKRYETQKEKKLQASKETVDIPQSEPQINPPQQENKPQTPEGTSPIQPIAVPIQQQSNEDQLMKDLRENNFSEYIEKKLEIQFQTFQETSQKEMREEIFSHFSDKISKSKHIQAEKISYLLCQKVDRAYEGKADELKEKIMFIFMLLENNDISYTELYVTESEKY